MSREVPFDPLAICDNCGEVGAFDFMGDLLCYKCFEELNEDYSPGQIENDEDE